MSNNLQQAKKDLKAFAKRAKNVKYTESLLFSYLITGMITFSIGLNTSSNVLYERMNKELVMSADKTRTAIKKKKKANEEAIEDLNLELIQLMEQGDQVVKSKWASWQNIRLMVYLLVETGQIMEFCQLDVEDLVVPQYILQMWIQDLMD